MGKFISKLIKPEERTPEGRIIPGITVQVPVNDAAKASPICQAAIDAGVYKPKDGESPKEMAAKLHKREVEAASKGIR